MELASLVKAMNSGPVDFSAALQVKAVIFTTPISESENSQQQPLNSPDNSHRKDQR